jgi:hypothetical protein
MVAMTTDGVEVAPEVATDRVASVELTLEVFLFLLFNDFNLIFRAQWSMLDVLHRVYWG